MARFDVENPAARIGELVEAIQILAHSPMLRWPYIHGMKIRSQAQHLLVIPRLDRGTGSGTTPPFWHSRWPDQVGP